MPKKSDPSGSVLLGFRVFVVIGGLIALGLGWSAQSEGILSHTGRKARIGTRNRLAYSFVDHLRSTFDFGRHLAVEIAAPRS